MKITVIGKNIEITNALRETVEKSCQSLKDFSTLM